MRIVRQCWGVTTAWGEHEEDIDDDDDDDDGKEDAWEGLT